jgi:hypothetical protein
MSIELLKQNIGHPFFAEVEGNDSLKNQYDLDSSIQKIKEAASKGMSIWLIVGARPNEPLEPLIDPIPDNIFLVTFDNTVLDSYDPNQAVHLWLDFNQEHHLNKIQHLADKIIIHPQVIKFAHEGFVARFVSLLKIAPTSQFIMQTSNGLRCSYSIEEPENHFSLILFPFSWKMEGMEANQQYYENYQKTTSTSKQSQDFETFKQGLPEIGQSMSEEEMQRDFKHHIARTIREEQGILSLEERVINWAKPSTKVHLEQYFNHVELVEDRSIPTSRHGVVSHFIATGVKT